MPLHDILEIIAWSIAGFGLILIILGSIISFAGLVRVHLDRRIDEHYRRLNVLRNREKLISRMIFGLDFLIASDIIISVLVPTIEDLTRLAGIVIIRILLTYTISKETQELERREKWEGNGTREASP
ncbi:MAG: DUF1622 domain-containing protein [Euryarchaeota archaeon]|nr:DUF1622 domain-containing protein [Euryarchaeota archaeon]